MSEKLISRPRDTAERPECDVARDLDAQRAQGIRRTLDRLVDNRPGRALYELQRSVEAQWKVAGLAYRMHSPGCPCGRRCQDGAQ